ncbi:hypothetical protein J1N35_019416, partial [Gossypium stocksii]
FRLRSNTTQLGRRSTASSSVKFKSPNRLNHQIGNAKLVEILQAHKNQLQRSKQRALVFC